MAYACRWLLALALATPLALAADRPGTFAASVGITPQHLDAAHWIAQADDADGVIIDADAIAARNEAMRRVEPSLHDLQALPGTLKHAQVKAWIEAMSGRPTRALYDMSGEQLDQGALDALMDALDIDRIPDTMPTRHGMVVRRADLRAFPTARRVFSAPGDTDIDRFQESALFPGTPVVVAHASRDGEWLFVLSETYAAWIERDAVALGDKHVIHAHARRAPFLVVTGAIEHTVFTPDNPRASAVRLDMGTRLPLLADWPPDAPVNGQHPLYGHVVELPVRNEDGSLSFSPALVPRSADVSDDYLPLTRANLIRQAFKFLGERYGWGHAYDARDCSGFVSEIYRSFGILLPRNTSRQSVTDGLDRIALSPNDDHAGRLQLLAEAQVGDLLFIPGHVMMVLGHEGGDAWVIHDTNGGSWKNAAGELVRIPFNGVVLNPLPPMRFNADDTMIDRITNIQRIRP